jgi:serine/threonine protein phosphatase PrpC
LIKAPITPRVNLFNFNKNSAPKIEKKAEPELKAIPEVKKQVFRKVKYFVQMSQAGWNPNMKKPNQDISFICTNFADEPNHLLFAVCDGHGTYGHDVSAFLEQNLPTMVSKELKDRIKISDVVNYTKMFEKSFQITNVKLKNDLYVDSSLSGATCVSVLYKGDKLICANIGDSRAVVGRCINGSKILIVYLNITEWVNHDLSRDHKPTDKDEGERVKRRGGRIEQAKSIFLLLIPRIKWRLPWTSQSLVTKRKHTRYCYDQIFR